MNEADVLSELLERAGERTSVGPPPIPAMLARARRARRRKAAMVAAAAVLVTVAGVGLLSGLVNLGRERGPIATGSPSARWSSSSALTSETELEGTWIVRAVVGKDGQSVLPPAARDSVRLTFDHGTMTGTTACNAVFGTYVQGGVQGKDLRFPREKLGTTLAYCSEPPLVSRLLDVRHVSGSAGLRFLRADNGMIIAELHRAP